MDVARPFPSHANRRTTRVGIEHELQVRDARTGATVPPERVRVATSVPVAFEPGGQVELNLPCGPAATAVPRLRRALDRLRADLARVGLVVEATPVVDLVGPLRLTSPRYVAMQRHFDAIGPAGRRMMRGTASTQVCLDWWRGSAGEEQWRVLNLAGPHLAAAYNSSSRLATWLEVDPDRTAFDGRLLRGEDPVATYTDFARRARRFTPEAEHLSTLFPPVRPRGRYLEVRFVDVQPDERLADLVRDLCALMYDDRHRQRVMAKLGPTAPLLGDLWRAVA